MKRVFSCSVVPIERALLSVCYDQLNLQRLLEVGDDGNGVRKKLLVARAGLEKVTTQLGKVTDALLADESGASPIAFIRNPWPARSPS